MGFAQDFAAVYGVLEGGRANRANEALVRQRTDLEQARLLNEARVTAERDAVNFALAKQQFQQNRQNLAYGPENHAAALAAQQAETKRNAAEANYYSATAGHILQDINDRAASKQEIEDQKAKEQKTIIEGQRVQQAQIDRLHGAAFRALPQLNPVFSSLRDKYGVDVPEDAKVNAATLFVKALQQPDPHDPNRPANSVWDALQGVHEALDAEMQNALRLPDLGQEASPFVRAAAQAQGGAGFAQSIDRGGPSVGAALTGVGLGAFAAGLGANALGDALAGGLYPAAGAAEESAIFGLGHAAGVLPQLGIGAVGVGLPLSLLPYLPRVSQAEAARQIQRYGEVRYGPSGTVLEK